MRQAPANGSRKGKPVKRPRPTTTSRGYGAHHQRMRERLKPLVESGQAVCSRCGRLILPNEHWDLDHRDDRKGYLGASHRACNRGAGKSSRSPRGTLKDLGTNSHPDDHPAPYRSETGIPCSRKWTDEHMTRDEWLALPADERRRRRAS